jgi:hypothetical protein
VVWPDYSNNEITVERDLEDFTRLHIKRVPAMGSGTSRINYQLYFSRDTVFDPEVKLFRAVYPDDSYLNDIDKAHEQLSSIYINKVLKSRKEGDGMTIPLEVMLPKPNDPERTAAFLMEAGSRGIGKLCLELRYEDIALARYSIPINLKPIGEFIEEYTVGDGNMTMPGDRVDLHKFTDTPEPGTDYILFVHGWNWDTWQKQKYAETTFKRLYWLGYKGRFGSFRWPCTYSSPYSLATFDVSEYKAFLSAEKLKDLIKELKAKNYKIHLYAHSQGNIVAGEALRQIAQEHEPPSAPIVESYTASQAAVPARLYDPAYERENLRPTNLTTLLLPIAWRM